MKLSKKELRFLIESALSEVDPRLSSPSPLPVPVPKKTSDDKLRRLLQKTISVLENRHKASDGEVDNLINVLEYALEELT